MKTIKLRNFRCVVCGRVSRDVEAEYGYEYFCKFDDSRLIEYDGAET